MPADIVVNQDKGYWDISFTSQGDIETEQSLKSQILLSIFEEKRVTEGEVLQPELRRGWLGNEYYENDFQQGSKAWLFYQSRLTITTLAELGAIIDNALQWLVEENIATGVEVEQPLIKNGRVSVFINLIRSGSPTERLFFDLWENTTNLS